MHLEGWGGLVLRDTLLRSVPQHEAEKADARYSNFSRIQSALCERQR
jgi:hypothetical protein